MSIESSRELGGFAFKTRAFGFLELNLQLRKNINEN